MSQETCNGSHPLRIRTAGGQCECAQVREKGPFETVSGPRFVLKTWCLRCRKAFRALSAKGLDWLGHDEALTIILEHGQENRS